MPVSTEILAPVTALLLLSCVMWAWMYSTRIPAVKAAGMKLDPNLPKGQQMSELPAKVRWKADNYNHLLEQPTLFYAVALTLALLGAGEGLNVALAWCFRHSPNARAHFRAGFFPLPERLRPIELHFGVRVLDESLTQVLRDRRNWYISYCDSDTV